jgi:ATPase subunit of ABC transporter with duplicated ATPase domains
LKGEEKSEDKRRKTLERELEWIRMSPKGRHAKSKARINDYETLASQEAEKRSEDLEIFIPVASVSAMSSSKRNRSQKVTTANLLFEDLNFRCRAAESSASSDRTARAKRLCFA